MIAEIKARVKRGIEKFLTTFENDIQQYPAYTMRQRYNDEMPDEMLFPYKSVKALNKLAHEAKDPYLEPCRKFVVRVNSSSSSSSASTK